MLWWKEAVPHTSRLAHTSHSALHQRGIQRYKTSSSQREERHKMIFMSLHGICFYACIPRRRPWLPVRLNIQTLQNKHLSFKWFPNGYVAELNDFTILVYNSLLFTLRTHSAFKVNPNPIPRVFKWASLPTEILHGSLWLVVLRTSIFKTPRWGEGVDLL